MTGCVFDDQERKQFQLVAKMVAAEYCGFLSEAYPHFWSKRYDNMESDMADRVAYAMEDWLR